jgi:dTDP-4-dehydrorhamnose reductase
MFILKSKQQISKAIERAKANHTTVRFSSFGEYLVEGSAGNYYTVKCEKKDGEKMVDCSCVAGQYGTPCYHAASALSLHVGLAMLRA